MSEHDRDYAAPWQVALRRAPGAGVCTDDDCDLSGGYAHVGLCEPCTCGKEHAIDECPAGRGMTLTPSEVALAKVLAAVETTPEGAWAPGQPHLVLADIATALGVHGYMYNGVGRVRNGLLTPAARALLDRARKAGVL